MVSAGVCGLSQAHLEELSAGVPCRGCGQQLLAEGEPPSWVGKGTMFFTDEERAAHAAAEQAFEERHPSCHALRWTMQGHGLTHCARCCPPLPMSPDQGRQIAQILNDAAERRVRQARRDGAKHETHELERRLPGRARSRAVALRDYERRRAKALNMVSAEGRDLLRASVPEAELMFRWRMQLGCGDIVEVLTLGDDHPPTDKTWSWAGSAMREGTYARADHRADEPPYQRVRRYVRRATLDLEADENLQRGPETVGYWTVELDCGHMDHQITPLQWHPRDGHQQTQLSDPDEVAWRKARLEQVQTYFTALEYAHAVCQIEQDYPEPDLMTSCWLCMYDQPIVAFERTGWLVPPERVKPVPAAEQAAARPTRAQLGKR